MVMVYSLRNMSLSKLQQQQQQEQPVVAQHDAAQQAAVHHDAVNVVWYPQADQPD